MLRRHYGLLPTLSRLGLLEDTVPAAESVRSITEVIDSVRTGSPLGTEQGPHPGHLAGVSNDVCVHAREQSPALSSSQPAR